MAGRDLFRLLGDERRLAFWCYTVFRRTAPPPLRNRRPLVFRGNQSTGESRFGLLSWRLRNMPGTKSTNQGWGEPLGGFGFVAASRVSDHWPDRTKEHGGRF